MNRRQVMGKALLVIGAGLATSAIASSAPAAVRPAVNAKIKSLLPGFRTARKAMLECQEQHNVAERAMYGARRSAPDFQKEEPTEDINGRFREVPLGRVNDKTVPVIAEMAAITARNEERRAAWEAEYIKPGEDAFRPIDERYQASIRAMDDIGWEILWEPAESLADIRAKMRVHAHCHFDDEYVLEAFMADIRRLHRAGKEVLV